MYELWKKLFNFVSMNFFILILLNITIRYTGNLAKPINQDIIEIYSLLTIFKT